MASLSDLDQTLEKFAKSRQLLREVYDKSKGHFDVVRSIVHHDFVRSDLREEDSLLFLSAEDINYLEKVVNTDPVVILSGQTNSGKSSLLNELLGGTYFPTKAIPCTARIVHVRYSDQNYLQLFSRDRQQVFCEKIFFEKKKVPEDKIALDSVSRSSKEQVECLVEVGLNHDLLRHGLQIYDVPGLGENEALDHIVQQCLDGMLQLLIYVIDGKTSLRIPDSNFIVHIKALAPSMSILFVCNKVEDDKLARKMDRFSDDESDEGQELPDRALLAFQKLKKVNLLPSYVEYSDDLDMYHGLSCTSIRSARMKKLNNEFTRKFEQFKKSLYRNFSHCVDTQLKRAVSGLLLCQQRLFDFFISDKLTQSTTNELLDTVNTVKAGEIEVHRRMKHLVRTRWPDMVEKMVEKRLEQEEEGVLSAAVQLEFQPITISERSESHHVIEMCRLQVRDFVLMLVVEKVEVDIKQIEEWYETEVKNSRPTVIPDDRVDGVLQSHLAAIWCRSEMNFDMGKLKDVWVAGLQQSVKTMLKQFKEDVQFRVKGIYLNDKWKRETASAVFRSISPKTLAKYVVRAIDQKLTGDHNNFLFAMDQITELCRLKTYQAKEHRNKLRKMIPEYGRNLCITDALSNTLFNGSVRIGDKIGEGSRMVIYDCQEWNRLKNMVVKIPRDPDFPNDSFSVLFRCARLLPSKRFKGKIPVVVYSDDWRFCILLPKYEMTLYDLLRSDHGLSLEKRLSVCRAIVENCELSLKYGLRLNNVGLNSVLVNIKDGNVSACVNLSKWQDLKAPYPDGKPAFHFAPEVHLGSSTNPRTFDVYSLAVVVLQLIVGKFVRPKHSESNEAMAAFFALPIEEIIRGLRDSYLHLFEVNWDKSKNCDFYYWIVVMINKYIGINPEERFDVTNLLSDVTYLLARVKDEEVFNHSLLYLPTRRYRRLWFNPRDDVDHEAGLSVEFDGERDDNTHDVVSSNPVNKFAGTTEYVDYATSLPVSHDSVGEFDENSEREMREADRALSIEQPEEGTQAATERGSSVVSMEVDTQKVKVVFHSNEEYMDTEEIPAV